MLLIYKSVLLLVATTLSEGKGKVNVNIIEISNTQRNIMRNMIGRYNSSSLNASKHIQSKLVSVENTVTLHRQHKMDQIQKLIEDTATEIEAIDHQETSTQTPDIKTSPVVTTPTKSKEPIVSTRAPSTSQIMTSPTITRPVARFQNPIYFRSCQEIYKEGFDISGMYIIDADLEGELEPFFVYCSMSYEQGVTLVLVGEELEMPLTVNGDNRPGSYVYEPTYEPTFQQMTALVNISNSCQQYIQYNCQGSKLLAYNQRYRKHRGWLVSRDDEVLINWGGAPINSKSCECGVTDSCITTGTKCNCDGPSSVDADQTDAGYITDTSVLPIKRVYLGDAAGSKQAFLTLGGLECAGRNN
ncbi:neurexin like receptor 1-like [Antedon mediterranea]|uniref:neurexin like receptor 1-like n=1 Tax=Antedon mediterranea TaxID=105859 RepID=UPI003AF9CACD